MAMRSSKATTQHPLMEMLQSLLKSPITMVVLWPLILLVVSLSAWNYWGREHVACLLYTSPSPRDRTRSRMPSSA